MRHPGLLAPCLVLLAATPAAAHPGPHHLTAAEPHPALIAGALLILRSGWPCNAEAVNAAAAPMRQA